MKANDSVRYVNKNHAAATAVVSAVVGSGQSGYKTLDLTLADGSAVSAVPHEKDARPGAGYWTELVAETPKAAKAAKPKRRIKKRK